MSGRGRAVFSDPHQRRWRWVRRAGALSLGVVSIAFLASIVTVLVNPALPRLGLAPVARLPQVHHLALPRPERPVRAAERRYLDSKRALSELDRGRRSVRTPPRPTQATRLVAYFVNWDDTSFTSLKEHVASIDTLVPEWLHLDDERGAVTLDDPARQDEVLRFVREARPEMRVVPLVNNFRSATGEWEGAKLALMLADGATRARTIEGLLSFVQARSLAGISVDFEDIPAVSRQQLLAFMRELYARFHPLGLEVSESVPFDDPAFDYGGLSKATDYLLLMAYDEHTGSGDAGPLASQQWFANTLERRLERLDAQRVVVAIGSYGYDWPPERGGGTVVSFQEAIRTAAESDGAIALDPGSLNASFAYADEQDRPHQVWFLNAVSAFNQLREAQGYGPHGIALWRLGSEDPTIWTVFDHRSALDAGVAHRLETISYGYDIDYEGEGEVLRVTGTPRLGRREVRYDSPSGLITGERIAEFPSSYVISRWGGGTPRRLALTFDDGPDPSWTPRVLDVLREEHAPATFFMIGLNADLNRRLVRRVIDEGHEIGNHTFTHPDISAVPWQQLRLEINATERLFEAALGRRSLLFRPPYAEDIEPETPEQVAPLLYTSTRGYYTIGIGIDPGDWKNPGTDEIVSRTLEAARAGRGRIVLLHDSGGDRRQTVAALPRVIQSLRHAGFELVTVSQLIGLGRDAVMPPVSSGDRVSLLASDGAFLAIGSASALLRVLFLVGIVLGVTRVATIGLLAIVQKVRASHRAGRTSQATDALAVVVPAFNEERVILRTIRSLLASNGPPFDIVIVDDGSTDDTHGAVTRAFAGEPRVTVFRKPNGGKSAALNFGLRHTAAPIVVALDADTVFHPDTVRLLGAAFSNPRVGAVAGNAKVGNRINLLTRWQALEYITSQNLDRRAFDLLDCITVVPGAVGAWRRELVLDAGGFSEETLAEDADLTMAILRQGFDIVYEERAFAYTEAPDTVRGFLKQRFRWVFGTLQAAWKQRDALLRPRFGALGLIALPNLLVFQVLFPLIGPVMDLQMVLSTGAALIQKHQHPAAFSGEAFTRTLFFYALFVAVDLAAALLAFVLEKREDTRLLLWLPLQRFTYRQLMYYVVVKSVTTAMRGSSVGWGKLERKATVSQ
jgi:peptidoglycan-N-acetylglucosamine deacetylase